MESEWEYEGIEVGTNVEVGVSGEVREEGGVGVGSDEMRGGGGE